MQMQTWLHFPFFFIFVAQHKPTLQCEEFVLSNRVTGCRCCFVVSPGDKTRRSTIMCPGGIFYSG